MMNSVNGSETMSGVDVAWLRMDQPTNPMTITGVLGFDEPLDYQRLVWLIEQRLLPWERFRQRVVEPRGPLGRPRWVPDPLFDPRAHVHRVALPAPGDQAALQDLVSDLMSTPLDRSRPLWQVHLVEGLGRGCAVVVRLHHCIADGVALMRVFLSLTDEGAAELRVPPPRPTLLARVTARTQDGLARARALLEPGAPSRAARAASSVLGSLGHLVFMRSDPRTALKGRLVVRKRVAWSAPVPLDEVKALGRALDATVNDVLLAAVSGALRRYLEDRGHEVDGCDLRAVVPVDLRPPAAADRLGNHFGLVFLPLPVGTGEPLARLYELKRRMDRIKDTPESKVVLALLQVVGRTHPLLERLVVSIFAMRASLVATNVKGPTGRLHVAGHPVRSLMFQVPQSGRLGVGVSVLSYAGEVWVGVATDAGLVPDPERIVDDFRRELDTFRERLRPASVRPAGPTRPVYYAEAE